jgi:hypothetical protein
MEVKLIKSAVIDGVLKPAGTIMEVDKAREREFKVLGIIENKDSEIIKAVKQPTEKRTSKTKFK